MNTDPGAAGLLWLWAVVAELGPGDPPEPQRGPGGPAGPRQGVSAAATCAVSSELRT
jgi:hypothetical protein